MEAWIDKSEAEKPSADEGLPGKYGDAGNFNGTNDYVDVGNQTSLHTPVFTISAWIKIHTTGWYDDTIIGSKTDSNIWFSAGENRLRLQKQNLIDIASTNIGITPNTWNNVAVTYDSSGNYVFYINGVNVGSGTNLQTFPFSADILIGAQRNDGAETNGSIDDVRIYNYPRTQQQIIEDMNAGHPTGGSPLGTQTGYWKFDEGYGTTAHDSTLNADNGTLSGSTTPSWTQSGKFGKALSFNGSTAYITMNNPTALQLTGALSLSAWVNPTSVSSNQDVIAKDGVSGNYGYRLYIDSSGKPNFEVSSDGTAVTTVTGDTALSPGTWYHLVGVYNPGNSLTIYVNGVQQGQTTSSVPSSIYNSTANFLVGAENAGATNNFNGTIDEVKVYAGVLTADQIKIDYNHNSAQVLGALGTNTSYQPQAANQQYCVPGDTSPCSPPVGEWNFEEAQGTTVHDTSGNGNDGTWSWSGTSNGAPQWVPGKIGTAGHFDGTESTFAEDRVTIPGSATLNNLPENDMTIEFWLYQEPRNVMAGNSALTIAGKVYNPGGCTSNNGWSINGDSYNYTIGFGASFSSTNASYASTSNAIKPDTWEFITIDWNATSKTAKIYVNGQEVSYGTQTAGVGSYTSDALGSLQLSGDSCSGFMLRGNLDNLKIFNYQRSLPQIAWDYNHGAPVGWWKFDECQGTTIHDSSGNGYNGTITLGAGGAYTAPGTCTDGLSTSEWYAGRNGKINSALALNDNNTLGSEYAKLTNDINMQGWTELTVSAWVNIQRDLQYQYIVNKSYNGDGGYGNTTYGLILNYDDPQFHIAPQGSWTGNSLTINAPSVISLNTWHHLVGTWDNNTIKLYVDGVEVANGPALYGYLDNKQITTFGNISTNGNYFFDGLIDDVRIYNYALTAAQVKTLYNNGAVNFAPATGAP